MRRPLVRIALVALLASTAGPGLASDTPIPRDRLALWLTAEGVETEDGRITVIKDHSGHGNDARLQKDPKIATGNPTVVRHEEAGQPVLRFDGRFTGYEFPTLTDIRTVFWVVSKNPAAFKKFAERFVLGGKEKKSVDFHVGAHWTDTIIELGMFRHGKVWFNGLLVDPALSEFSPQLAVITLAAGRDVTAELVARDRQFVDRSWHGDIGEIIVYTRPLGDAERQAVEGYLLKKYRITPFRPVSVTRESVLPGHTTPPTTGVKP